MQKLPESGARLGSLGSSNPSNMLRISRQVRCVVTAFYRGERLLDLLILFPFVRPGVYCPIEGARLSFELALFSSFIRAFRLQP